MDSELSYIVKTNPQQEVNHIYSVFVQTTAENIPEGNRKKLKDIGIRIPNNYTNIFTANLSIQQIKELSDLNWIAYISKSKKIRFKTDKKY